jgi:hypothetical protein
MTDLYETLGVSKSADAATIKKAYRKKAIFSPIEQLIDFEPTYRRAPRESIEDRFWGSVVITDGCWDWLGSDDGRGYGFVHFGGKRERVNVRCNRLSYMLFFGPIPEGMVVMHKCDNPACNNPDHLTLGTQGDNVRDASAKGRMKAPNRKKQTHCRRGHEFTPENTYWHVGRKHCRICREAANSRYIARSIP